MTDVADLLGLPAPARLRHRLTKKEIIGQHGAGPAGDARLLTRVVASATIVGVLRAETIGVKAFQDDQRCADFIPVLDVTVTDGARPGDVRRAAELLHRSMPRPAVIAIEVPLGQALLSLALTRLSRNDSEGETSVIEASLLVPIDQIPAGALAVRRLDQSNLWALYRDLVRTAAADGHPASVALTAHEAVALRQRLVTLRVELDVAVRSAKREQSVQRRIDLNTEGRRLRSEIADASGRLFAPASGEPAMATTTYDTDGGTTP